MLLAPGAIQFFISNVKGVLITLSTLWKYYQDGWSGQPAVRLAEEGGYLSIFKGEISITTPSGGTEIIQKKARSTALERLMVLVRHIKSEAIRRK